MKEFYFKDCTPEKVVELKNKIKRNPHDVSLKNEFNMLVKDTKTALSNIEECINDSVNLNQRLENLKLGNTSFISDVIGVTQKGNGESYYRAFIALDEKTVIEIRISEHPATKISTLKKSNNLSQYLFQVVLLTPNTTLKGNHHINNTGQVGNLKVVTEKYFSPNSTINDMIGILKNIHDYLMNPGVYYEQSLTSQKPTQPTQQGRLGDNIIPRYNIIKESNQKYCNRNMRTNKKVVRLTESKLKQMIAEAVQETLNELDPRTLASAASKAEKRGDKRASKFRRGARDAWNRDFGYEYSDDKVKDNGWQDYEKRRMGLNDYSVRTFARRKNPEMGIDNVSTYVFDPSNNSYHQSNTDMNNFDKDSYDEDNYQRTNKAEDVAWEMQHGTGKYNKEKGRWE